MRVLVLGQHYYPEVTAAVNRLTALTETLQKLGHEATVIAPKPNHPAGVIAKEYRGPAVKVAHVDGVEVHYTWVYTSPRKSLVRRVLYYATFTLMAVVAALRLKGKYDAVFASCPPPLVGVAGWVIAKLKRARFVLDVRDLWPGLAIAIGELTNPVAIAAARTVESFTYRTADGIIAVTKPFQAEIERRTGYRTRVDLIPNGALPMLLEAGVDRLERRAALKWEGRFVVSYVGNVGVCQGLMHVVDAAERLQSQSPDVLFFIQGHGIVKDKLVVEARRRGLTNLVFGELVPSRAAASIMAASDALLVPLVRVPMAAQFIPSKLFDSMAVGVPVLLSVEGEARCILEEARGGLSYRPEDGEQLAARILELRASPQAAREMGARGRQFVRANFMRTALSERMVSFIEQICGLKPNERTASPTPVDPLAQTTR